MWSPKAVAETWRQVWGGRKNFLPTKMRFFSEKISILAAKFSDDFFLVIDQVFRIFTDFPDLYFVKCRTWPFPHKKNTLFYTFHTFVHIRQHYFSKYWGGRMHGPSPHLKLWGGPSPVPLGFRPCPKGLGNRLVARGRNRLCTTDIYDLLVYNVIKRPVRITLNVS